MFEKYLDQQTVQEIRARAFVYFGFGAIAKFKQIAEDFRSKGIDRVLVVTSGSAYKTSGAWDVVSREL
ncbi:MAG: hypothetical protein IIZ25_06195, partial [Thermoguttaceae bacterium]|nr:hypothetical protein [Thermoguttaceae bacterium]